MKRVVLYIKDTNVIGGIETFIYNFCVNLHKDYDITVVAENMADVQVNRLKSVVPVINGKLTQEIECDTLVMLRVFDEIPSMIKYKKSIRRIHTRKAFGVVDVPKDCDMNVCVSNIVKEDFGLQDAVVINNLINKNCKGSLFLVSATRIPAPDKGDNEIRMRKLAGMLEEKNIPYLWLNFSDGILENAPKNFYNIGCRLDIQNYIKRADYLVQLSSVEAFSNSLIEALTLNVPVITTDLQCLKDMGYIDGVNGYTVPFDMNFDVTKLLNIPKFRFKYDNKSRIEQWKQIL